jgi:NarL family two-component system sensor histidine kinase LiaS
VLFTIQDNGIGFSVEEGLHNGGVGLATMRERAERINGTCQIVSSKEAGTKIEIKFLLK